MAKPRGYTRSLASGRVLAQERLVVTVAELVSQALEQRRVSRDELADTLGVPTVELSRRLSGRTEVTLRSLAGMFHALGYRLHLSLIPLADAAPLSGQAPNLPADLAGGTIRASLKGGPGDGQTVHVPVTALEDHGPGPAPVLQVAVVDGHAHVIDTARQEIRAKADVAPLVYVRNISADRGEPVYRYRGRLSLDPWIESGWWGPVRWRECLLTWDDRVCEDMIGASSERHSRCKDPMPGLRTVRCSMRRI